MNRREFASRLGRGAAGGFAWMVAPACAREARRGTEGPNLLYIMADDLGYADLSIYGRADYATPVLDGLAAEGIRLTQAYSAAPVCSPTRVALMTGQYPARHEVGLYEPLTTHPSGLSPSLPTLPRRLKNAGYETALIGKWHLGLQPQFHPFRHGFDAFFGHLGAAVDYVSHVGTEHGEPDLFDGTRRVENQRYTTEIFTERAVEFIERERQRPFFLSLQYNAPHWPWQAPGDAPWDFSRGWAAGGSPETFAQMVRSLDEGIGRVLEAIRRAGIERNTLVIFTSDNGGERWSDMGPFRQRKMTLWEGGIRVAAMVRWPGVIPAGATSEQVAVTMDWTATLLAAGGVPAETLATLDGIDLLPILTGRQSVVPRELFWRTFQRTRHKAMRSGDWKYLVTETDSYLFDLSADPGESENRKQSEPAVFEGLAQRFMQWASHMREPIPLDPARA